MLTKIWNGVVRVAYVVAYTTVVLTGLTWHRIVRLLNDWHFYRRYPQSMSTQWLHQHDPQWRKRS